MKEIVEVAQQDRFSDVMMRGLARMEMDHMFPYGHVREIE